jgi:O-antigen ligase
MEIINKFVLFLFLIGLLISDRWLNEYTPGLNASYLIFPFFMLSFSRYSISDDKKIFFSLLSYIGILLIFFILSGGMGYTLLTTTIGTTLIALATINMNFRSLTTKDTQFIYIALTFLPVIAYYLGMWESRTLTSDRQTFMYNNENIIAQQLCEGLAFCVFVAFSKIRESRWIYLLISSLFIVPITATISRTGIALMIITIFIFAYSKLKLKGLIVSSTLLMIAFLFGLIPKISFITNNQIFQSFLERTIEANEDIRFKLWEVSWNIAKENILTGIGFGNYESEVYRYRIGENANLGFQGFGSPHNSFIDLLWIGGIWLVAVYIFIIYRAVKSGLKFIKSSNNDIRNIGALILSLITGVILFSMTGQAATDKRTWFIIAICYLWMNEADKRSQLKSLS